MLRFFDSRYKVSLTWEWKPRLLDFRFDALVTELVSVTQGLSSTVDVYTRKNTEAQAASKQVCLYSKKINLTLFF